MKTLSTEQQVELQKLLENLTDATFEPNYEEIMYWAIELKPKRVRKKGFHETTVLPQKKVDTETQV